MGKGERREDGEEGGEGRGESGEVEREREENERRDDRNEEGRDIAAAAKLFHKYGSTLDFYAQKNVRVIVAGRYSNMGAAIIASSATSLPSSHIIASPCLVAQRVKSAIACKLGLNTADVEQVCLCVCVCVCVPVCMCACVDFLLCVCSCVYGGNVQERTRSLM